MIAGREDWRLVQIDKIWLFLAENKQNKQKKPPHKKSKKKPNILSRTSPLIQNVPFQALLTGSTAERSAHKTETHQLFSDLNPS